MPTYTTEEEILDELVKNRNTLVYEEPENGDDPCSCYFLRRMPCHTGGHRRLVRLKTFRRLLKKGLVEQHHEERGGNCIDGRWIIKFYHAVRQSND